MSNRDWTGNKKTTFVNIGASNHSDGVRDEHDYYATDPDAIDALIGKEDFLGDVWECACGGLHLANRLREHGFTVRCSDIVDRVGGVRNHRFFKGLFSTI